MPRNLARFLDNLPPSHNIAASDLLERHTAFPYFAAFVMPEDRE
jgi:hypothetical protein